MSPLFVRGARIAGQLDAVSKDSSVVYDLKVASDAEIAATLVRKQAYQLALSNPNKSWARRWLRSQRGSLR